MKKEDINFLFLWYLQDAFTGDVIQPAEIARVNMCPEVEPHYNYTIEGNDVSELDNAEDGEDEESYGEMGTVDHTDEYD